MSVNKKQPAKQPVTASTNPKKWVIWAGIIVLFSVVTLLAVLAGGTGDAGRRLSEATGRTPEASTELYFSNISSLTKKVKVSQTLSVPTTIRSHETAITQYNYTVTLNQEGKVPVEVQHGQISLDAVVSAELPIEFIAPSEPGDYDVTIALLNRDEKIHYKVGVEK